MQTVEVSSDTSIRGGYYVRLDIRSYHRIVLLKDNSWEVWHEGDTAPDRLAIYPSRKAARTELRTHGLGSLPTHAQEI